MAKYKPGQYPPGSMKWAVQENQTRKCKLKFCVKKRYRMTNVCFEHWKTRHAWGSAEVGRKWHVREVDTCLPAAKEFLKRNYASHPGIQYADQFLQESLDTAERAVKAAGGLPDHHLVILRQLRMRGITSYDLLLVVVKLVMFLHSLPQHQRHYDVFAANLGWHCARLGRKNARVQPHINAQATRNRAFGAWLFGSLRPLIVHLVVYLRELEQAKAEHLKQLDVPFDPPTSPDELKPKRGRPPKNPK